MKKGFWYRLCWAVSRGVAFFAIPVFFPHRVENRELLPREGAVILVANHIAWYDPIYLAKLLLPRKSACMAKAEIFEKAGRAAAWFLRNLGAIPVRRGTSDMAALKGALGELKEGLPFYLFPEGTRNRAGDESLAPFNTGAGFIALMARVPVIPVYIAKAGKKRIFQAARITLGQPVDLADLLKGTPNSDKIRQATRRMEEAIGNLRGKKTY